MIKISVIIVNYNVRAFLEQALLSVRRAGKGLAMEVFVVDNKSVDDSVAMVREKFPEVGLIANQENTGFAVANNQAIRVSRGEYVLLLNPDTVVEEDSLSKCISFMDGHDEAGGLGVKMIDGTGQYLPESKRGFPTPWVAFSKAFGLSRLFPKSRLFNRYHLGYLSQDETHEVDVLAGAFMFLRRSVLDRIGLLDEAFFMYGEDIDLSYRIVEGGYKNYYFAGTTIIHYKGESTKKGSLNYVKTFYQAMIIFGEKHFTGGRAKFFIGLMKMGIFVRAGISLVSSGVRKYYLPFLDALLMVVGMLLLKDLWSIQYFDDPHYYRPSFLYFNIPLYTAFWLLGIFFSGGYDKPLSLKRILRGVAFGTLALSAVYGFLDDSHRTSRALLLLGSVWAASGVVLLRYFTHFLHHRHFKIGKDERKNLVIVGSASESDRAKHLLYQAQVQKNIIGTVSPGIDGVGEGTRAVLSELKDLGEVVRIYRIQEIIFCSKDVRAQDIMYWMTQLGTSVDYKIIPEESLHIIGSAGKDVAGELYTIDIRFNIAMPMNSRNKRMLDLGLSVLFLCMFPFFIIVLSERRTFLSNIIQVLLNRVSWVGYSSAVGGKSSLPPLKRGVLSPLSGLGYKDMDEGTKSRLDFLYAKDYEWERDVEIIIRGWKSLGIGVGGTGAGRSKQ